MEKLAPELEPIVMSGEAWTDKLLELIETLPTEKQTAWQQLSVFARTCDKPKPTGKWLKEAKPLLEIVGLENFNEFLVQSLKEISKPATRKYYKDEYGYATIEQLADENGEPMDLDELPELRKELSWYGKAWGNYRIWCLGSSEQFNPYNALTLKGFLWCILISDPTGDDLAHTVAKVADASLKKVAGIGVKEIKLANTSVYVLSQMTNQSALSALVFLDSTVTFKTTLAQIKKALNTVAERLNLSFDDLLEIGIPTFGLQNVGERIEQWGETTVTIHIDDTGSVLKFSKNGKNLKSAPTDVKTNFADELKQFKAFIKDIDKNISAINTRLDNLMISKKSWTGDIWQERYLNHPLTGTVARRLVWVIDGVPAFFNEGQMCDIDDKVAKIKSDSVIKLFHPIDFEVEMVLNWREKLFAKNIKQPFKQVWREVYILTDAERKTHHYSNRFAGHILKQHQLNQLAKLRGWEAILRISADADFPAPHRNLTEYGLRSEYWVHNIGDEYGVDTTEAGAYLRVSTDQLRFYPIDSPVNSSHVSHGHFSSRWGKDADNGLPLESIAPKVLSEIMRDVDLFVGVASIGNDPTWADGGASGAFRDYWQSYGFGDLSQTAKSRAEYLKLIIPRLNIADKLSIDGKFLIVQGKVRTYKIHLGSSNILMLPNDQYLCIIPSNKKSDEVNLDFSGDRVFSLILSKAMLLVNDDKIKDEVILKQIHHK
ncbi:DUF4132 domain-containing protein [Moraxella oblonga]|uniref:DUF4132 domain-containing protein n=1 Tax=Moraxella oblonga TaxID=200413 RepID=UPI000836F1F4|nr:DUF4132 domain-containing protein [Moraxella oblonga]